MVDIVSCEEPVDGMEPLDAQFKRGRELLQDLKEKGEDAVWVSQVPFNNSLILDYFLAG